MKILGIDPGSVITGYGLINAKDGVVKLIEAGIIKMRAADPLKDRIHTVYRNLNDVVVAHKPDVLVLEKLYTHHSYRTTASILGHVRGVICLLCAQKNIILAESSVKRIRKAVTGNGGASKKQTQVMVAHLLSISEDKLTADAGDALALAIGYISLNRKKI
ncbi:MAG: crossover junction endodeoxyribonuclease RuvC [Candidatus Aceula meridiana]|nr:crossover junction endodeoxyribonuclease RuvC [Candidatus Aceula meridiana]